MNEHNLTDRLRLLTDTPVEPPGSFRDDLLRKIRAEFETPAAARLVLEESGHEDDDVGAPAVDRRTVDRPARTTFFAGAAAFFLVVGTGFFLWWLRPAGPADEAVVGTQPEALSIPGPVDLAAGDVLWPAIDTPGTASSVAVMFAHEVLGWNQPTATETEYETCLTFKERNAEICSENTTTVILTQSGVAPLEVIMDSIGGTDAERLWAVAQVGSGHTTDRLEAAPETGTRIPLPSVEDAATADITMRIAHIDDVVEVTADREDLASGFVDTIAVPDRGEVLSILIRYRNLNAHVVSAAGGPWNGFYEWPTPEPDGPEITIAEGRYEGSDLTWRLSAVHTTDGGLCLRLAGMSCVGDIPPDTHLGALTTTSSSGAGQEDRWCVYGPIKDADAVEIRLPDGARITTPIYTNPNFEVAFYAYCSLGPQPAEEVAALDSNGNIIDTAPNRH